MVTIRLRIPDRLARRIAAEARRRRMSLSELVRETLEPRFCNAPVRHSRALDLVADLAGAVKGPRDLSTNPKYMKDFGL